MAEDITAADLCWSLSPAPWPNGRLVVKAALEHLPFVTDDDAAALIEHLVLALADVKDERDILAELLREALVLAHTQQVEIGRLRTRYHALLDARRAA
ncbi:MAG: hypothetical protein IT180_10830 [Acidobacteria bacterium]|nr:hypothetical protein [Acidobacteriota bacterium]